MASNDSFGSYPSFFDSELPTSFDEAFQDLASTNIDPFANNDSFASSGSFANKDFFASNGSFANDGSFASNGLFANNNSIASNGSFANTTSDIFNSAANFSFFDLNQEATLSNTANAANTHAQAVGNDFSEFFSLDQSSTQTTSATASTQDLGGPQDAPIAPIIESSSAVDETLPTPESDEVQDQPLDAPADDVTATTDEPFTLDFSGEDDQFMNMFRDAATFGNNAALHDHGSDVFAEPSNAAANGTPEQDVGAEQNMGWASPTAAADAADGPAEPDFAQNMSWAPPAADADVAEQDTADQQNMGWASPTAVAGTQEQDFSGGQNMNWVSPTASAYPESHDTPARTTIWSAGGMVPTTPREPTNEELAAEVASLKAQLAQAQSPAAQMAATRTPSAPQTPSHRTYATPKTPSPRKRKSSSAFIGDMSPPARPQATRPSPIMPSSGQGLVQAMWSPGVSAEERMLLVQEYNYHASSPAAMNFAIPTTPTPNPPAKKRRTYKPKDPSAPKKAPATKKSAAKKGKHPEESAFEFVDGEIYLTQKAARQPARPVAILMDLPFDTLTQVERATLLLPMLQGMNPLTGEQLSSPGIMQEAIEEAPVADNYGARRQREALEKWATK